MTIGKQATGGRCPTVGCIHQRVCADRITLVHFFFHRNLLLLYEHFVATLRRMGFTVATGEFGADMQVTIANDGPVTVILDTETL